MMQERTEMRHHLWAIAATVAISFTALLTGCGGGGSDSSSPQATQTFQISGAIAGADGVTVRAEGQATKTASTDASGNYSIGGLSPGDYTITPTQAGHVFDPDSKTVTIVNKDVGAQNFERLPPGEGLSTDVLAALDASPNSSATLDDAILEDGQSVAAYAVSRGITSDLAVPQGANAAAAKFKQELPQDVTGPQQRKKDVITKMLEVAYALTCGAEGSKATCPPQVTTADAADPKNQPAQVKYVYLSGIKDPTNRAKATRGGCPELRFGLDCSGLIYQVALAAQMQVVTGQAIDQGNPKNWTLPKDWQLEWKVATDGTFQAGDLVVWSDHIGIVSKAGADPVIISSLGTPGDCERNLTSPRRGPVSKTLSYIQKEKKDKPFTLRLVATLSGTWDAFIRCTSQTTDAAVIRFNIDNDKGGPFETTGHGTDYNGTPLSFVLSGNYDQVASVASGTLFLADGSRSDSFSQKLVADDTGYFAMTKVIDNGGCPISMRLNRVKDTATPQATKRQVVPMQPIRQSQLIGGNRSH
jgi:cell wall-associated NlpC family hydrolase